MLWRLLVAAAVVGTAFTSSFHPTIVGGVEAERGEFPYIVSLRVGSSHFCGGQLISPGWVLTASHCIISGFQSRVTVSVGAHSLIELAPETFRVERVMKHPSYINGQVDFDFALVKIAGESAYDPIAMNGDRTELVDLDDKTAITAGWGTTYENGNLARNLRKVEVPIVSQDRCRLAYPGSITDRMICAGLEEGGKDSCQGDSGGPLIVKDYDGTPILVGMVSWGEGCARAHKYGVYSRVSEAVEWIHSVID